MQNFFLNDENMHIIWNEFPLENPQNIIHKLLSYFI